jgi:hypothetical protein
VASHDTLIHLFERINFFLQRLNIYTGIPLKRFDGITWEDYGRATFHPPTSTKDMTSRKMSELIHSLSSFLADYGLDKFLKRLVGRTVVEESLQRLDTLTKEETLMAVTRSWRLYITSMAM